MPADNPHRRPYYPRQKITNGSVCPSGLRSGGDANLDTVAMDAHDFVFRGTSYNPYPELDSVNGRANRSLVITHLKTGAERLPFLTPSE